MFSLRTLRTALPRNNIHTQLRRQSGYQAPSPPGAQQSNPHRDFYKQFSRPVAKNFLIAVLTYQVLYYAWLKMESIEVKEEKGSEMKALEGELKGLTKGV